jgi:hypothetical protein
MYSPRPMEEDEEESRTNESPTSSVESPFAIKSPQRCRYYLPALQEGKASHEYEEKRVSMYPASVHTDITSMVPRCTTTDLDLQDALDSPKKETWVLNHHKLRCLACLWSPSDTRRTGSPELDNKSDFFFVTKYGKGLLPSNMYITLCEECMHTSTWTSFPVTRPDYIEYGTLKWKLAQKEPGALQGQRLRPIIANGVTPLDRKPETKKTPPSKRPKLNTEDSTVMRSPLSNIENNLNQIGFIIQHKPHLSPPKQPQP